MQQTTEQTVINWTTHLCLRTLTATTTHNSYIHIIHVIMNSCRPNSQQATYA